MKATAKFNLKKKLNHINAYWQPHIAAELNGQHLKLVKLKGDFVWHHHEQEDELFYVIKGQLIIQFREGDITLNEGDCLVIPRGVEHCPHAAEECHVMLLEPVGTRNTGNVENDRTVSKLSNV